MRSHFAIAHMRDGSAALVRRVPAIGVKPPEAIDTADVVRFEETYFTRWCAERFDEEGAL